MAGPIVCNDVYVKFVFGPPTQEINLECHAIAVEIVPSSEEIDVGTFCNPTATDQGRTTYRSTITFPWSPELHLALAPHVGELGNFAMIPDQKGHPNDYIQFSTRFSSPPWGRFELGQRVEVELPIAVLTEPNW